MKRGKKGKSRPPQIVQRRMRAKARRQRLGGPSPSKIARLLETRRKAWSALYDLQTQRFPSALDEERAFGQALQEHGEHLIYVLENAPELRSEYLGEELWGYRNYRAAYARYGAERPFFDREAFDRHTKLRNDQIFPKVFRKLAGLSDEVIPLRMRSDPKMDALLAKASEAEYERLTDLLLMDCWMIADILPAEAPSPPPDWSAPPARAHAASVRPLLERGPDLDLSWLESEARAPLWKDDEARHALVRVATDPGLLAGWPGLAASWAPYHAMALLGELNAHEAAGALRALVEPRDWDDWYGDFLFEQGFGRMGLEVLDSLWATVRDLALDHETRGLALLAFEAIGERHPEAQEPLARALAGYLEADDPADPQRKTVNAYLARVLDNGPFPTEIANAAIEAADAAGRIDRRHFDLEELRDYGLRD